MPQIANQDYTVAVDKGSGLQYYPELLRLYAKMAGAIQRGTIFDFVIKYDNPGNVEKYFSRPLSVFLSDENFYFVRYVNGDAEIDTFELRHTEAQYNVLADIAEGGAVTDLTGYEEYLTDANGIFICIDGKYITVELDQYEIILSYKVTNIEAVGVELVNIPFEDAPGLIGLFAGA